MLTQSGSQLTSRTRCMRLPTRQGPRRASSHPQPQRPPTGPHTTTTRQTHEGPLMADPGLRHRILLDSKNLRVARTIHLNSICHWGSARIILKEISKSTHNKISNSLRQQELLKSTKTNRFLRLLKTPGKQLNSTKRVVTLTAPSQSTLQLATRVELPTLCLSPSRINLPSRVFSSVHKQIKSMAVLRLPILPLSMYQQSSNSSYSPFPMPRKIHNLSKHAILQETTMSRIHNENISFSKSYLSNLLLCSNWIIMRL